MAEENGDFAQVATLKEQIAGLNEQTATAIQQAIVRSLVVLCKDMNIQVVAEGIETPGERDFLRDAGIHLMQGYLFAKSAFRAIAELNTSALDIKHQ